MNVPHITPRLITVVVSNRRNLTEFMAVCAIIRLVEIAQCTVKRQQFSTRSSRLD